MIAKKILKKIYSAIPFKKELFVLLKLLVPVREDFYRHLHFYGVFKVKVNNDSFKMKHYGFQLENEVFWKGLENGWEKISISLWRKLCMDAKVIVDIGANTGIYALVAATINPSAKIIALEPVERVFRKLEQNVMLNHFHIQCLQLAASNFNGKATIYDTPHEHIYSVTVNTNLNQPGTPIIEIEIGTTTLDTLTEQLSLSSIDLIKIDVETHEPEVLEGYKNYLPIHHPTMLIEVLNEEVANKINNLLKGLDYLYFNIDEVNGIRHTDQITKSDYYNYLVCSPQTAKRLNLIF